MPPGSSSREEVLRTLFYDRRLAHRLIFEHDDETSDHIERMIDDFHFPPTPFILIEAFRGGAKSTTAEEGIAIQIGFRQFSNMLLLGANADRAADRLTSIKNTIERNEKFIEIFGNLRGPTWSGNEIVTSTGFRILALGRGQDILGVKYLDKRPDIVVADDIEDRNVTTTESVRGKAHRWLMADVIPACVPNPRVVFLGTNRHPDDVVGKVRLSAGRPGGKWTARRYPIEYKGAQGERRATWPTRFPLSAIDGIRQDFEAQGLGHEYRMEYMCEAASAEDRTFKSDMLRVEPRVRTWQAVYTMLDPARTVGENSASTGMAAWSYIGPKIVVWDAWGKLLMPNEIVDAVFDLEDQFHPVLIGVEKDGLNEWLMQPIRQESLRRQIVLPVKGVLAPRGKMDFIKGLQPYANARELEFAKELPELRAQLLSFPAGRIDAPNALAYALKLKPGAPIYEDFNVVNIAAGLEQSKAQPVWLALNASGGAVTAALLQYHGGMLCIFADWVREGEPSEVLSGIVREANLEASRVVRAIAPPQQFDRYNNAGLVQAANRIPIEVRSGAEADRGRSEIRISLTRQVRGFPAVIVSSEARWTLNAFSGGYARALSKQGIVADYAEEGHYRVLMEGIESFAGLMSLGSEEDLTQRNYRTRPDGSRYVSALRTRA